MITKKFSFVLPEDLQNKIDERLKDQRMRLKIKAKNIVMAALRMYFNTSSNTMQCHLDEILELKKRHADVRSKSDIDIDEIKCIVQEINCHTYEIQKISPKHEMREGQVNTNANNQHTT